MYTYLFHISHIGYAITLITNYLVYNVKDLDRERFDSIGVDKEKVGIKRDKTAGYDYNWSHHRGSRP